MSPKQRSTLQGPLFFLLLAVSLWTQSDLFFDQNLVPRIFLTNIFALFLYFTFHKVRSNVFLLLLLAYFLLNLISGFWALNANVVFYEAQKVLLYGTLFSIGIEMIRSKGLSFVLMNIILVFFLTVLINFGLLLYSWIENTTFHSTSAHPNLLASVLMLFIILSYYYLHQCSPSKIWKHFTWITIILGVCTMVILQAKASIAALFIFSFGLLFWTIFKKHNRICFIVTFGFAILITTLPLLLQLFSPHTLGSSLDERFFIWSKTYQMILNQPHSGYGAGNWIFHYPMYGIEGFSTIENYGLIMQRPHNDFLWVLSELGWLGLLLLLSPIFMLIKKGVTIGKKSTLILIIGCIALLPIAFYSFSKSRIEHIVLFFLLLAFIFYETQPHKELKYSIKAPMIVVIAVSIVFSFTTIYSIHQVKSGLQNIAQKKYTKALKKLQNSQLFFYTHTPEGYPTDAYIADCFRHLHQPDELLEYSYSAYQKAPFNYEIVTNLGMALNTHKRFKEAEKVLLESLRINPYYDGTLLNLAIVNYNQKEYKKAKKWIDKVNNKSRLTDYYSGLIHQKLYP